MSYFFDADRQQAIASAARSPIVARPVDGFWSAAAHSLDSFAKTQFDFASFNNRANAWDNEIQRFKDAGGSVQDMTPQQQKEMQADPKYGGNWGWFRYLVDKHNEQHPDAPFDLPSNEDMERRALAYAKSSQQADAARSTAQGSFGAALGGLAGDMLGQGLQPSNIVAFSLFGAGPGMGLLRAVGQDVLAAGVGQLGNEALTYSFRRDLDPNYSAGDVARNVAEAGLYGGAFAAGQRAIGWGLRGSVSYWRKWRESGLPVPREMQDAGNVVEHAANIEAANPFPQQGLAGENAHVTAMQDAYQRALAGKPVEVPESARAVAAELPARTVERRLRAEFPDDMDRLDNLQRQRDANADRLDDLNRALGGEEPAATRRAMIAVEEATAKAERLEAARDKTDSAKQRARLDEQAQVARAKVVELESQIDPQALERLQFTERERQMRADAQARVEEQLAEQQKKVDELKRQGLEHYWADARGAPAGGPTSGGGFRTEKGSTYVVHEDGTTTRNKAARNEPGHEGDAGQKPRTARTVYVDADASALSAAGLSGIGPHGARVVVRDGKATLLAWNEKKGRWGAAPSSRNIPVHDQPAVGRYPLELWDAASDVPGHEAYARQHAGNKIVEVTDHTGLPPEHRADVDRLRKAIDDGKLPPGADLEGDLAKAHEVVKAADERGQAVGAYLAGLDHVDNVNSRVRALIGLMHEESTLTTRVSPEEFTRRVRSLVDEMTGERTAAHLTSIPTPQASTAEFTKWFGNSKITDDRGAPMVVHHGTTAKFNEFDNSHLGKSTKANSAREGFFFTNKVAVADSYAVGYDFYKESALGRVLNKITGGKYEKLNEGILGLIGKSARGEHGRVVDAYLKMENPAIVEMHGADASTGDAKLTEKIQEAKAAGHDGVVFKDLIDMGYGEGDDIPSTVFVVFDKKQIRALDVPVRETAAGDRPTMAGISREHPATTGTPSEAHPPLTKEGEVKSVPELAREAISPEVQETAVMDAYRLIESNPDLEVNIVTPEGVTRRRLSDVLSDFDDQAAAAAELKACALGREAAE